MQKPNLSNENCFEQGPIRPPSEASSLLLRLTRNCPWNRCSFCSVYKRADFSLRPLTEILSDIDAVSQQLQRIEQLTTPAQGLDYRQLAKLDENLSDSDQLALRAAGNWFNEGMQSIFLQDANSLVMKPQQLITILDYIRQRFPCVQRITSYARSQTIDRISDSDMQNIAQSGLNRIHIGLESGSDRVLTMVQKGCDQAQHIRAGQKIKRAGIQLSEYVMPGLGGKELSDEHARETASALNQINPDFIRLRTLALPKRGDLFERWQNGTFTKMTDGEVAAEIRLFLQELDGISSTIKSDHILNLFQEIEGTLPEDKPFMLGVIDTFKALPAAEQMLYQLGRRMGLLNHLNDLKNPQRRQRAVAAAQRLQVTPENIDDVIDELMKRFV